ncbi:hypothetical protein L4X63_03115 [Geomonas sp. Red32]|uniref:dCTP deaminase domain-containing protein n=1 Tax=Geomonas sp. Red32 TaxID=2912856 RepID=UPI00202CB8A2|nr:hypothetical protein [Geomonas sp. Red32]MCM0080573.1 hypothetical protein [Geomonas sp. Red32]
MAFWGSDTIRQRQITDYLVLPFENAKIKHGQYLLSVGPESFITVNDIKNEMKGLYDQVSIEPGQFAIILTEETVTVPKNAIAFISIRASIKFRGLINVSGFHVDPGFSGRLKFAVYNAGPNPVVLERGQAAFPIWFADTDDGNSDEYDGDHKDQRHITANDVNNLRGRIASPNALKQEIDDLKQLINKNHDSLSHRLTIWTSIAVATFMLFVGIWAKEYFFNSKTYQDKEQSTASHTQK